MSRALSTLRFNKQQIRLSVLTLLVFFVTLFSHVDHLSLVKLDTGSVLELDDCHLCHQGIDSAVSTVSLYLVSTAIFNNVKTGITDIAYNNSQFILPFLRAPPLLQ
jgi:hypothetical protein